MSAETSYVRVGMGVNEAGRDGRAGHHETQAKLVEGVPRKMAGPAGSRSHFITTSADVREGNGGAWRGGREA